MSGIRGLKTRIQLRKLKKQEFYRPAHKTARLRAKKKLVSRESWYKKQDCPVQSTQLGACSSRSPLVGQSRSLNSKIDKNQQNKEQESIVKAVMFVPYTPGSHLAKKLRENEEHLVKITGSKVKIVERTGIQLQDLLTRSNPWKGSDCLRTNCMLCFTKNRTEKNKTQDCHQRNVVYETRCLTCQEQELDKIQKQDITEQDKKSESAKIKLFKYIGETSRSTYERGWEHLNDFTQLKSSSHMLKHVLTNHQEQEIDKIKFGMKILRTCKSSFERQINESVLIQQERKEHHILNSRSEYNRCSLPRLSTQLGESEYEKYNKELEQEKKQEEILEIKIRQLRKQRNKTRLVPSKSDQQNSKRRKINENNDYISIQEVWGPPNKPEQVTRQASDLPEQPPSKKTKNSRNSETPAQNMHVMSGQFKLTNLRTIEKIIEVPENNRNLQWEEPRDWDKVLREHRERIEKEELDKNVRLEKQRKKIESWELYNICKKFLEENSSHWSKRREQQIEEQQRLERMEKARIKTQNARNKHHEKIWDKRLEQGLEKVSREIREQENEKEIKEKRAELKHAKANLWKLRNKENKLKQTENCREIRTMENKVEHVKTMLEKEKNRLLARDKNVRTAIKNTENKAKKQEVLAEVWTTYRWITEYLVRTTEDWEKEKIRRDKEQQERLQDWNSMTRAEKIKNIITENNIRQEHENKEVTEEDNISGNSELLNRTRTISQEIINSLITDVENKIDNNILVKTIINEITADVILRKTVLLPPKLDLTMTKPPIKNEKQDKMSKYFKTIPIRQKSPSKPKMGQKSTKKPNTTELINQSRIKEFFRPKPKKDAGSTPKTPQKPPSPKKTAPLKNVVPKNAKKTSITPKVTKKRSPKYKEDPKTVQQLRGYWTQFAKEQKEKAQKRDELNKVMLENNKKPQKPQISESTKNQTVINFEASPNALPGPVEIKPDVLECSIPNISYNPGQVRPIIAKFESEICLLEGSTLTGN